MMAGATLPTPSPHSSDSDEFKYETKAVVLNFMSLLPAQPPVTLSSSASSSGDKRLLYSQNSQSSLDSGPPQHSSWRQTLGDLPEMSLIERFDPNGEDPPSRLTRQSTIDLESPTSFLKPPGFQEEDHVDCMDSFTTHGGSARAHGAKSPQKSPMVKRRSTDASEPNISLQSKAKSPKSKTAQRPKSLAVLGSPLAESTANDDVEEEQVVKGDEGTSGQKTERQTSEVSATSEGSVPASEDSSLMASARSLASVSSSYVSVRHLDVDSLVRSHSLPPSTLALREEIDKEWNEMERSKGSHSSSDYDEPDSRVLTPETEVAEYLRVIGDKVNSDYGPELDRATESILQMPREKITYEVLRQLAHELLLHTSGLTQVTLLLLLGQRLAWSLLSRGERGISLLVEYVARLIEDNAAEFIINRGGWSSLTENKDDVTPLSAVDIGTQFSHMDRSYESPLSDLSHPSSDVATDTESHGTITGLGQAPTMESIASVLASAGDAGVDIVDLPGADIVDSVGDYREPTNDESQRLLVAGGVDIGLDEVSLPVHKVDQEVQTDEGVSENVVSEFAEQVVRASEVSSSQASSEQRAEWMLGAALSLTAVCLVSAVAVFTYKRFSQ